MTQCTLVGDEIHGVAASSPHKGENPYGGATAKQQRWRKQAWSYGKGAWKNGEPYQQLVSDDLDRRLPESEGMRWTDGVEVGF